MTFAAITVDLPADIVDRLRGTQPRQEWLSEAALRLARQQVGFNPLEPVDWGNRAARAGCCGQRRCWPQ